MNSLCRLYEILELAEDMVMFICTEKERKGEDTKKQQWVRKRRDLKVKEEDKVLVKDWGLDRKSVV